MQFGLCTSITNAAAMKAVGWDYVEANVQNLLQADMPEEQWQGERLANASPLPVRAANVFVPGTLPITGPAADLNALRKYCEIVLARAAKVGIGIIVFGSGKARNVPDGFDRQRAQQQLIDFARPAADAAQEHNIIVGVEPLNRGECNIITTVAEAAEYVRAVDHPHFRLVPDSYHMWLEDEPLDHLAAAMPLVHHVHLADKHDRTPPGESGQSDYRPLFRLLRQYNYAGLISVEAAVKDLAADSPRILAFLRRQWDEAGKNVIRDS
jgi:D-psicose/D-tagatose/L-ribulose 3-epimerase